MPPNDYTPWCRSLWFRCPATDTIAMRTTTVIPKTSRGSWPVILKISIPTTLRISTRTGIGL